MVGYFRVTSAWERGKGFLRMGEALEIRFRDYEAYLDHARNHLRNGYCSLKCYEIARASWSTHARARSRCSKERGKKMERWGGRTKTRADRQLYTVLDRGIFNRPLSLLETRMAHFHLGCTFGTQSSAIKPVCKNFEKHRNIPLHGGNWTRRGGGEERRGDLAQVHNPSAARLYHEQPRDLAPRSFKIESKSRGGRRRGARVDDGAGERGRRKEKIRRWRRRRRRRGTSARSRATIRDHLPCSTGSSSLPDPPRRRWRRGGGKSGVAPIIKLFTHTVRHLSSGPAILTCYYLILTLLAIWL